MRAPFRIRVAWRLMSLVERRPVMQQPADLIRAASDRRSRLLALPVLRLIGGRPDRRVDITTRTIELADGTSLPLRIYRPRKAIDDPRPIVINFHGGGWVSGDARQSEWWCSGLAAGADAVVVSVDYRIAPEFPYPAATEDCYATVLWAVEHAPELGADPGRLAVMGDSAGGNLATVTAIMARDRGGPPIGLQILIYPAVDAVGEYPSKTENAFAPVLTGKDVDHVPTLYFAPTDDPKHPYISPLFADHHDLPPALVQTAQYDPLRDQGAAYAAALRDAGVPVRLTNYVDAVHGFISLPYLAAGGRQAMSEAVAEIRRVLA